jgi:cytochrome c oxidase assembly protein subunit 11
MSPIARFEDQRGKLASVSNSPEKNVEKPAVARSHRAVALSCVGAVAMMVGAAYAAVPLYRLFCQKTGFAGTTQRAEKPSMTVTDKVVTIRFDANVASNMPWKFKPDVNKMDVRIGENSLAFFKAHNMSDRRVKGTAVFNVTPDAAGAYFQKIECFCFTEQVLEPGESVEMPVSFYVDPAILDDDEGRIINTITLSYTFYPVDEPDTKGVAAQSAVKSDKGGG